jgi:hypothetical protein
MPQILSAAVTNAAELFRLAWPEYGPVLSEALVQSETWPQSHRLIVTASHLSGRYAHRAKGDPPELLLQLTKWARHNLHDISVQHRSLGTGGNICRQIRPAACHIRPQLS